MPPGIIVDEKICVGGPVLKGTPIPVDLILGKLAGGMNYEEVIQEYDITREHIPAALRYAAKTISDEEIRAVG
jgi:uncharacterized protein (DUF433 family)